MFEWYRHSVMVTGRQPLFLALVAFVATFVVTRLITRLIRSGRGPFRNVDTGGVHIHHVVPGVVCLMLSGLMMMSAHRHGAWFEVAALVFGVGMALVLDEFALILHLDDVYWKREGVLSVDAITVALAVMAATLWVVAPEDPPGPQQTDALAKFLGPALFLVFWAIPVGVSVLKGKMFVAAIGVITPVFAWFAMWRLAKPKSPWAAVAYEDKPEKMARAVARNQRMKHRLDPLRRWWASTLFGFHPDEVSHRDSGGSRRGDDASVGDASADSDRPPSTDTQGDQQAVEPRS